jgi:CDGSH-type Zn-finger protein
MADADSDAPRASSAAGDFDVEIKVRDHGPYKVTGRVRLIDAEGVEFAVEDGGPIALCRCGQSRTKPFCDASHKESGFESCVRARRAGV